MAATVVIYSIHSGDSTTCVSAAGMRFKLADNDTEDLNNPCRIPTADQIAAEIPATYSFIKHLKAFVEAEPVNTISNLRFFTDAETGELGTGIYLQGDATDTFHEPVSQDSTGDTTCTFMIVTGGGAWTKSSPLVVNAGTVYTNGDGPSYFGSQNYVILQTRIDNNATPGTYPSGSTRTFTYRYDEN